MMARKTAKGRIRKRLHKTGLARVAEGLPVGEPAALRKALSVEKVVREVARWEGLTVAAMRSACRTRAESRGRLLTALVAREVGGISIAKTGRYFGRDASSMVRGVARLEESIRQNVQLRRRLETLRKAVHSDTASKHD